MKNISLVLIIIILSSFAFGADGTVVSETMTQFESQIKGYGSTFQAIATSTLLALGVIQLVITFGFMDVRGELEFGGIVAELMKTILVIGFFYFFIKSPNILLNVIKGFDSTAVSAGGTGANIDNLFTNIWKMWTTMTTAAVAPNPNNSFGDDVVEALNPLSGLGDIGALILGWFTALIATIAVVILGGQALMYYAFSIFSVYVGIMWIGFGSLEHTRPWAINAITNIIRYGAKYMMTLLIIGLSFNLFNEYTLAMNKADLGSMIRVVIFALLIVTVNSGVGGFVDSFFTGSGGGENNRGMQLAQSAASSVAGGAIGGVMGGSAAVRAAKDGGVPISMSSVLAGATKGAMHGAGNFSSNWAKTIDPNYSQSSNGGGGDGGTNFASPKPYDLNNIDTKSDGDVGGGAKGSIAEPKVGGEINPNQSDKS